jgi:hypothetical protein
MHEEPKSSIKSIIQLNNGQMIHIDAFQKTNSNGLKIYEKKCMLNFINCQRNAIQKAQ